MNNEATKNRPISRQTLDEGINAEAEREGCRALLESIAKGMVDYPECVSVSYDVGDKTTIFKIDCEQKCIGQIIGSKGKNINGVRAVVSAIMARKGIRAIVEIPYFSVND